MTASPDRPASRNSWAWIPSLYFAEGIPYVVVMLVSVILYKRLGVSNTEIALYTSWLYLPWVIKPLWSPFVDAIRTKRWWIISMQLLVGAGLAGVALTIPGPDYLRFTLAFFWLLAFSSATHDIAADGFYMLGLSTHDQAWFVGIRSTFYRLAMITGQGLLIILAGYLEAQTGLEPVEITVRSVPGIEAQTVPLHPDSVKFVRTEEPRIVLSSEDLAIPTAAFSPRLADSLLRAARDWNTSHLFYPPTSESDAVDPSGGSSSLWKRMVSGPLERAIRAAFGQQKPAELTDRTGGVGLIYVGLSAPPGDRESVVVNLGRRTGDPSIRLVEGSRFTFTNQNWDKVVVVAYQLDPKLDAAVSTRFTARSGNIPLAWSITFYVLAGFFVLAFVYHRFILPYPPSDRPTGRGGRHVLADFVETFGSFFRKKGIGASVAFLLLFRFAEAQLVKLASPFLLDAREVGGLSLTTGEVGFAYGTVGVAALTAGGLIGGFLAARNGLKHWLWPMVVAINIPNAVYIFLAYAQPESLAVVNAAVAVEQFGYGFGFTAYMLYMILAAEGEHKTAHFAICTGFMALGMMIPGMFSGWLQEIIGYERFFVWILIATIPGFAVSGLIRIDPTFGIKTSDEDANH